MKKQFMSTLIVVGMLAAFLSPGYAESQVPNRGGTLRVIDPRTTTFLGYPPKMSAGWVIRQAAPAIETALLYEKTLREAKEREEGLQRQIQELRIELDEARQDKQVAEITETDYFQQLRGEAEDLRKIIKKS